MPEALTYSGFGTYRWPDGRRYRGGWQQGVPHGTGEGDLSDGGHYRGQWQHGVPHGLGELTHQSQRYVGNFVSGQRSGSGVQTSNEGLYRGQWLNDVPHGNGEFHANSGATYTGEYQDGQRHGYGVAQAPDGSRYQGEWQQGQRAGFGQQGSATGREYRGGWVADLQQGYGRSQDTLGNTYEGTWVAGQHHGYGRMTTLDGASYEGEWQEGQRNGHGRARLPSGIRHSGHWRGDEPDGYGVRTDIGGLVWRGDFRNDRIAQGSVTLSNSQRYEGVLFDAAEQVNPEFLRWVTEQAQANDPAAQLLLGRLYTDYQTPLANIDTAVRWLQAASRRLPQAHFRLGTLLLAHDPQRAVDALMAAAKSGHTNAHLLLGSLYASGQVVQANGQQAKHHFAKALSAGSVRARHRLAWLLATSQEAHLRDPAHAIVLMEPLAQLHASAAVLDTLAAAYAAADRYEDAIATLTRAISIAQREDPRDPPPRPGMPWAPDADLTGMQQRLEYYRSGRPYIELLWAD